MTFRPVPARGSARLPAPALVSALALAALAACGDSSTAPGTPGTATAAAPATLRIVLPQGATAAIDGKQLSVTPGDTARLAVTLHDARGAAQTPTGVTWAVADRAVAEVDASGLLRARGVGTTTVVASAARSADSLTILVSDCGSAQALALDVGQVRTFAGGQGAELCVFGGAAGAEYAFIPVSADARTASTVAVDVTASGVAAMAPTLGAASLGLSLSRAAAGDAEPRPDLAFHTRLRRGAEPLAARMAEARQARRAPRAPGVSLSRVAATANVGDVVTFNVSETACAASKVQYRGGRVAAVTQRTIVVADTLNPAGGFTDADYRSFGVTFDTLVHPVDVENFGEPSDVDGNGKVIIFFTSAVNALTPRASSYYVGGFFFSRDLFPNDKPEKAGGCAGSNSAEMFYMLVPDPSGQVNGNRRSTRFVREVTVSTLAHEFEHLINSSRRLYVNDADDWEDTWLDEGLAHVAEELLFYRAAGLAPRSGLTASALGGSARTRDAFEEYATGNFGRLASFLEAPETSSPFADDDDLETRGATWSFLRYAADRASAGASAGGSDTDLWRRLVNARTAGRTNLSAALGGASLDEWLRDWAVANFADGRVAGLETRYTTASWNFPDVFGVMSGAGYPLATRTLADGRAEHLTLDAGSAAYLRFAVPGGKQAVLRARDGTSALPASVRIAVVRTK